MVENTAPQAQREVQRLLGRCLLRLQQYEHLLKSMVARSEVSGAMHEIEPRLAARVAEVEKLSLGLLMKSLFGDVVVLDRSLNEEHSQASHGVDAVRITTRLTIQMSEEALASTKSSLKDLVELRNELVHHLIERFDLGSEDGCAAAVLHLQASHTRIDTHYAELSQWANSMRDALAIQASFMQTEVFEDWVVNGIDPDGTIDWPAAGIVSVLRQAYAELNADGWTRLDNAVAWIDARHSEQTPAKYGCKGWPDVLDKSRAFDLVYRPGDAGQKVAWYRERR